MANRWPRSIRRRASNTQYSHLQIRDTNVVRLSRCNCCPCQHHPYLLLLRTTPWRESAFKPPHSGRSYFTLWVGSTV